jgi:glycosyltransferase involved in cell wall biosynthesis
MDNKEHLKILHIAPTPFFADRGCHIRILGEIRTLQANGNEIFLTTYHNGRNVDNLSINRIINIPWYEKLDAGSSWHKFYLDVLLLVTSGWTYHKKKPDIIHGHLHEGALIGKLVSLILSKGRTPVIFDSQGSLTGELETYGFFGGFELLKVLFKWIEKIICRLPNYILSSSESNRRFLIEKMGVPEHKVTTILDGIDRDFFYYDENEHFKNNLGISNSKKIIIYTGSLIQSKGIDYLLDAIPLIIENYDDVCFLIVGYPVEKCEQRVKETGVEDSVVFTGKVEYSQLPKYLSLADIAVDPKVSDAGEASGKIINYMGAGLPVVCFDTINNRTLLGNKGFYANQGDHKELASQIIKAIGDLNRARKIGDENRRRAYHKFSWKVIGNRLLKIYHKAKYH